MDTKVVLEKIRKIREIKEIKQFDIAKQLELSTSAYGKLERGETELTLTKLKKIADILGVDTLSLLDGTTNYGIENGNQSTTKLYNSLVEASEKEFIAQLIVSQNKEVIAKDEIIATQKDYILHLKEELEKKN